MTTHDHDGIDRLDDYLDRLAHDDHGQPPVGLDPWLAATVRAVRAQSEAAAPDSWFVARLRETLLMDASIPLPNPNPSLNPSLNGTAPSQSTSLPPLPISAPDQRHRDARRHLASLAEPSSVPTAIGTRRRGTFAQRWNRHGWPIVELLGVAALIIGLVSVMMGGSGGGGLPALVPGFGQNTQVSTPVAASGAVAMAYGNGGRTGEMPGPGVGTAPEVVWSKMPTSGSFTAAPVVAGDTLYAVNQGAYPTGSQVVAYDTATGNLRWQAAVDEGRLEYGAPAVSDGLVLVPVTDYGQSDAAADVLATPGTAPTAIESTGALLALDAQTGQTVWRFATGGIGYLSPLVVGDLVYVSDGLGTVQAITVATGVEVWNTTYPIHGTLTPNASLSFAGGLVYAASNLGALYAFDAENGEQVWSAGLGGNYPTTPVVAVGTIYVATSAIQDPPGLNETELIANPNVPASAVEPNAATPPAGSSDPIATGQARLYAVDAASGETSWSVDLDYTVRPAPMFAGDTIVISGAGENSDEIVALDAATGTTERWSLTTDGYVDTSVVAADGIGYVGTFGSTFYAIDLSDGSTSWSVQTAGHIGFQAYVGDGLVFMASSAIEGSALYALGRASDATPGAASMSSTDISGLPPCTVDPRPETATPPVPNGDGTVPTVSVALPEETPEYTLDGVETGEGNYLASIAWSEIPVGTSAMEDQVAGISGTLEDMQACDRPGNGRYIAAFYSEDYFLRSWVVETVAYNGYRFFGAVQGAVDPATIAEQSRVLPDGRVAVLRTFEVNPDYGQLFVFVEQDGQWLIDEYAEVSQDGVPDRG